MPLALKDPVQNHLANIRQLRRGVVEMLSGSTEQNAYREELAKCAVDTIYWINTYLGTYDPRARSKFISFKLWPKQEELVQWLATMKNKAMDAYPNQISGLCEKSRDVG